MNNQNRYIDAFQEHVNNKYGLASPKNNRRIDFTDASEMISRYKGDVFEGGNAETKAKILSAVMERGITDYGDFKAMLAEFGTTRTRNAGRSNEYENVKLPDAPRGINLKEYVFSPDFIALPASEKQAVLSERYMPRYEETGEPRPTPDHQLATLQHWHDTAAKEVKYLNGAFRATYRAASAPERAAILAEREHNFYQRFNNGEPNEYGQQTRTERMGRGIRGRTRRDPLSGGRNAAERGPSGAREQEAAQHGPEWDAEHDLDANWPGPPTEPGNGLRNLSRLGMDGWARGEVLLSDHAPHQLDQHRSATVDPLRRGSTGDGTVRGRIDRDWRYLLAAEYEAYMRSTMSERREVHAAGADRLTRRYDGLKGGGVLPREFEGANAPRNLSRIPTLASTPLMHTGRPAPRVGRGHQMRQAHAKTLDGQHAHSKTGASLPRGRQWLDAPRPLQSVGAEPRARALAGMASRRRVPRSRNTATGREADSVLSQLARDREEAARARDGGRRHEFEEIRLELDASRLLATLAHTHGVIPEKYEIARGRNGGDRIKVGSRYLNVTDFLTKELNLSWQDAAPILRQTFHEQTEQDPEFRARQSPQQTLWREYQAYRQTRLLSYREQWLAQGESERNRKAQIRGDYLKQRSTIQDNPALKPSEKKSRMSLARMTRIEQEAALREVIELERAQLKARGQGRMEDRYREFLAERAQAGDERALAELRRVQRVARPRPADGIPLIAAARAPSHENAIIYHGARIEHVVHANGDVTYSRDGRALLEDEGYSLRMWESDADAIELGLRLATSKFGNTLDLSGPEEFRMATARAAAEISPYVRFTDDALNEVVEARIAELRVEPSTARARGEKPIDRSHVPNSPTQQPGQQPDPFDDAPAPAPDLDR